MKVSKRVGEEDKDAILPVAENQSNHNVGGQRLPSWPSMPSVPCKDAMKATTSSPLKVILQQVWS